MLRQAQLLVSYRDSPIVGRPDPAGDGPQPGDRAPDCGGLTGRISTYPLRLYDLLRDRRHVLLLYGSDPVSHGFDELASAARELSYGDVEACAVIADGGAADGLLLPAYRDGEGEFGRAYGVRGPTAFLVRPDGHVGARLSPPTAQDLTAHLTQVFGTGE